MSGSNPFDDLAEDNRETEDSTEGDEETGVESRTSPVNESGTESGQSTTDPNIKNSKATPLEERELSEGTSVEGPTLSNSSPPFPYSEAEQKQMYVQNGLWDEFEDLGFDAELELRRTFGVRNVEQRELDTAIIRLVLDRLNSNEIAEMVIQMRGFDPSTIE